MKRILLISLIMISSFAVFAQQDTLVTFKFKVKKDSTHTYGNSFNAMNIMLRDASYIDTLRYVSGVDGIAPADFALSSINWDNGMDTKYYYTSFSSSGHHNILISSKHKSSNTGPKDFKLQYKVGAGGTWTDVTGGTIACANDNFILGVLTNVALPVACDNQPDVSLRWIMTSNTSVNLGTVAAAGTSRIDNVFIIGDVITGIHDNDIIENISIYPNPSNGKVNINNPSQKTLKVEVLNLLGDVVSTTDFTGQQTSLDLSNENKGIYFVRITNESGSRLTKKLILK
jgi:hypothetical protein